MKRWLREPLLQFLLVAAVLFAFQAWRSPPPADEIRLPDGLNDTQREHYIQEQVLIREARRRGLDQGDSIIERQLQHRMRMLIESQAAETPPDDATLHTWLAAHPERYREPPRMDFEYLLFTRSEYGGQARAQAEAALVQLRDRGEAAVPAQTLPHTSTGELRRRFGKELAAAAGSLGTDWTGPLPSGLGWHVARVTRRYPAPAPDFEALRHRLSIDWLEGRREQALTTELARLRAQYRIVGASE